MRKLFVTLALAVFGLVLGLGGSILTQTSLAQTASPAPAAPIAQVAPAPPNTGGRTDDATPNRVENLRPGDRPSPSLSQPSVSPAPGQPLSSSQLNPIDRRFIVESNAAAIGNIILGQLALQRATQDATRQYAQAEIDEQIQVRNDLARIAPTLGLTLSDRITPTYRAAITQLSQLTGDRFDQAFLNEGGINAHLMAAALYQREAAFGQNPEIVDIANRFLPVIATHFDIAGELTDYRFAQVPQRFTTLDAANPEGRSGGVQ
ncbi:MAG: DUF4142 domain-containing protein [Oculatellaceae cyanobacterium Prado106]|jgi:putative membrane protein|nr:DUF4142 domain-containing protein [Oculatellaceae cyanobacterium Prado106]